MFSLSSLAKRSTLRIWIAMLAILFSALAPAISHALAASAASASTAAYAEICSIDGVRMVSIDAGAAKRAPATAMQDMEHCAYCLPHGHAPALQPSAVTMFAVNGGHDVYPSLFYQAPRPLHGWSAASPRGPPAIS